MHSEFSPAEFLSQRDADDSRQPLDLRGPWWEIEIVAVAGSIGIALQQLPQRLAGLDADRPLAVLCHSGGRSARAAGFLVAAEFSRFANITGGIDARALHVDGSRERY